MVGINGQGKILPAARWAIHRLASRYDRNEIFKESGQSRFNTSQKNTMCDVYLVKVQEAQYPVARRGFWPKKAADKSMQQALIPELSV